MNNGRHDELNGSRGGDGSSRAGCDGVDEAGDDAAGEIAANVAEILRRVAGHRAALVAGDPAAIELQGAVDDAARLFGVIADIPADDRAVDRAVDRAGDGAGVRTADRAPAAGAAAGGDAAGGDAPDASGGGRGVPPPGAPVVEMALWLPAGGVKRRLDDSRLSGALYRRLSAGWSSKRGRIEDLAASGATTFSARLTALIGRHPYFLTGCATSLALLAGAALMAHAGVVAAVAVTFAGLFELVDGAGAKQAHDGRVGVFIDYVGDRVSDLAILGAVALSYGGVDRFTAWAAVAALTISFLSSYARAQAEALQLTRASSVFGRAERFVLIVAGYWLALAAPVGAMRVTVLLAAVISSVTFVERVVSGTRGGLPKSFRWEPEGFLPQLERQLGQPDMPKRAARRWTGQSLVVQCQQDSSEVQDWRVVGVLEPVHVGDDRIETKMQLLRQAVPLAPEQDAQAS